MDIRKNFFPKGVSKYWDRLPREVVVSPSLEVFARHLGGHLGSWLDRAGLMLGLTDLRGLFQPKISVIL